MSPQQQSVERPNHEALFRSKLENTLSSQYTYNKLKINDIASTLAMCERQLFRNVRHYLNMTPTQYLRQYRLKQALVMLRQGQSVNRVTFEVGFSSYSYFARCFKREFGCTAKEFTNGGSKLE